MNSEPREARPRALSASEVSMMRRLFCLVFVLFVLLTAHLLFAADPPAANAGTDPLIQLLTNKGVLTPAEAKSITAVPPAQQHDRLLTLLQEKGIISPQALASLAPAS